MYNKILFFLVFLAGLTASGQNEFQAKIKDSEINIPLMGANAVIKGTNIGATANEEGVVYLTDVPDGKQTIVFSFIGF